MGYISNDFIKNLINNTSIVKVISSKINLKKIGEKYKSFCPFHIEKNPSFIVDDSKNFYYCFGCKSYGNVIDFLMNYYNINFIDSIKELAYINGVNLVFSNSFKKKEYFNFLLKKKYFYNLILELNNFYHKSLLYNKKLLFVKKFLFNRGLNIDLIKRFSIGYSSVYLFNEWIYGLNYYKKNRLLKFKILFRDNKGRLYDKLYNRIIFPIYNLYNKIIAFGGRSLNKNCFSKYINSSNNIFFSKKNCLYGLNYIKKKNNVNRILVVEGYMDVISLYKFKINYSVGLLGSFINNEQIKTLYFYTDKIIFCYDGDSSGLNSCKKTINLVLNYISETKESYFIFLPNNEDPDSIINKEGKSNFENRINNSLSIFKALFKLFFLDYNLLWINESKFFFIKKVFYFISKIKSPLMKLYIRKKLFFEFGINDYKLNNYIYLKKINLKFTIFRCLISLLLKKTNLSNLVNIHDKLFNINIPGLLIFLNIVILCINNKNITFYEIIKFFRNKKIRFYLEFLFFWNFLPPNSNYKLIFLDLLKKLKIFIIDKRLNKFILKDEIYGLNLEEKKIVWYLVKLKNLNKI